MRTPLPKGIRWFFLISLVLNVSALLCEEDARYSFHLGFPYSMPGLNESYLPDLHNFDEVIRHVHTPAFFDPSFHIPFMYPAAMVPLYGIFSGGQHEGHKFAGVLGIILLLASSGFGIYLWRHTKLNKLQSFLVSGGSLLLSYPVFFELKQGNMEIFVGIFVGAGVWYFLRGRLHHAAALFGVAMAMKIFPFVYLGLFLSKRQYKPILTAVFTAVLVTSASLYYTCPSVGVAARGIANGLAYYQRTVPTKMQHEIGYDHSLFGLFKRSYGIREEVYGTSRESMSKLDFTPSLRRYLVFAALTGLAAYGFRIRTLPVMNQILCLCIVSILFPPVSFDYTLLHLYVPWTCLVMIALSAVGRKQPKGLLSFFILLAVATSIETEFIFQAQSLGGQIKALSLLALFVQAMRFPLPSRYDMPMALQNEVMA